MLLCAWRRSPCVADRLRERRHAPAGAATEKEVSIRPLSAALVQQRATEPGHRAAGGATGALLAAWSLEALRRLLPASLRRLPVSIIWPSIFASDGVGDGVAGHRPAVRRAAGARRHRMNDHGLQNENRAAAPAASGRSGFARADWSSPSSRCRWCCSLGASLLVVSFNNLLNVSPGQPRSRITRVTLPVRYGEHLTRGGLFRRGVRAACRRAGDSRRRRDDARCSTIPTRASS